MQTKRYLCIQRIDPGQMPQTEPTPEQMQQLYAAFNSWMEKFKANLTEIGGRLESTGRTLTRTRSGAHVTDGPFPETKEVIGGFMIITADTYEAAVEIARELPAGMCPGSSIEIREISTQF